MNELFGSEVQVKSPRLRWMEKHRLVVVDNGTAKEDEFGEYSRFYVYQDGLSPFGSGGDTEDEAIANWAKSKNVRLWNEE